MNGIPELVISAFMNLLKQSRVPPSRHAEYLQWLRYYLDFCDKYSPPQAKSDRVRLFCEKLSERKQTPEQQQRAAHAVSLYFVLLKKKGANDSLPWADVPAPPEPTGACRDSSAQARVMVPDNNLPSTQSLLRTSNYLEAGYTVKSDSPEWDAVLERLAAEIKVRHPPLPATPWPLKPEDDYGLHPLRPRDDGERADKPPGLLPPHHRLYHHHPHLLLSSSSSSSSSSG